MAVRATTARPPGRRRRPPRPRRRAGARPRRRRGRRSRRCRRRRRRRSRRCRRRRHRPRPAARPDSPRREVVLVVGLLVQLSCLCRPRCVTSSEIAPRSRRLRAPRLCGLPSHGNDSQIATIALAVDQPLRAGRHEHEQDQRGAWSARAPGRTARDTWPNGFLNSAAATNRLVATGGAR